MHRPLLNNHRIGLLLLILFLIPHGLLAQEAAEFEVGSRPVRMTFDGEHVWVTNTGSDTVTKLRTRDGRRRVWPLMERTSGWPIEPMVPSAS